MKIKALLLSLLLATTVLADNHLTGPSVTVDTDGSQVSGQVNIATQGTGAIQFFTNRIRRGYIDGTTGVLTGFSFGSSTLTNPVISGNLTFSTAAAKIIPGATSFTFRNTADGADNLSIANGGDVTLGQGNLIFSAAAASITGGATSLTVKSAGSTIIDPQSDAQRIIIFSSTSDTAITQTFGDGTIANVTYTIAGGRADSFDDSSLCLASSGDCLNNRGSYILAAGNEAGSVGDITISSGAATNSLISLNAGDNGSTINLNVGAGLTNRVAVTTTAATFANNVVLTNGTLISATANKSWVNGVSAVPADVTTVGVPQILTFTNTGNAINAVQGSADALGAAIYTYKSRSVDGSADTIVQSGDVISNITAYGANGATFDTAARIQFTVNGTPGASADMPGAIDFQTSPDGSATLASVLKLDAAKLATFSGAIKSTANTLGWVVRTGANTACTTTCGAGKGCAGGFDITGVTLVDCANAAADSCFCSF